ncbi:hypothetical protein RA265_30530, partial [Pseudomonas syringae pv. tagetis]|uniref:hypothetical protein n=1 Tax=Pseudomonas syringae group genomosp. 7 TaxID=251699 RepID=UPI00376FFC65
DHADAKGVQNNIEQRGRIESTPYACAKTVRRTLVVMIVPHAPAQKCRACRTASQIYADEALSMSDAESTERHTSRRV